MKRPTQFKGWRFYADDQDYCMIEVSTNSYYINNFGKDLYEGLATAIAGSMTSLCTTPISPEYLRKDCKRIKWEDMPEEWQQYIYDRCCTD